ncbi:hypothetical protein [Lysinibacter cavernae]|uniref:Uncharacterized protein n=1 Tax=Lysinibacter cavernae TaxID=1640652 RepID=A0A7X5R0Q3_9MICO|nr:hypothetical protein [Lysinibacter cavernae]NIH53446.1 hypothetical protein [Lysinibacter cavernae]
MKRMRVVTSLITALSVMIVTAALASTPTTEATWADRETGTGLIGAVSLASPLSTVQCEYLPALGLNPTVRVYWKLPDSMVGVGAVQYGYVSDGLLLPVTGALLGSVTTTGTQATGYTTVYGGGLLGGLLGGNIVVGVRTAIVTAGATTWYSPWLTATASAGIAGAGAKCVASDRPT